MVLRVTPISKGLWMVTLICERFPRVTFTLVSEELPLLLKRSWRLTVFFKAISGKQSLICVIRKHQSLSLVPLHGNNFTLRLAIWLVGSSSNDSDDMTVMLSAFSRLIISLIAWKRRKKLNHRPFSKPWLRLRIRLQGPSGRSLSTEALSSYANHAQCCQAGFGKGHSLSANYVAYGTQRGK